MMLFVGCQSSYGDAGPGAGDASVDASASDSDLADAGGTSDGAPGDAEDAAGDAAPQGFKCPTNVLLCETFDPAIDSAWSLGAGISLQSTPTGNVLTAKLLGGPAGTKATIARDVGGAASTLRLTFSFRATDPGFVVDAGTLGYSIASATSAAPESSTFRISAILLAGNVAGQGQVVAAVGLGGATFFAAPAPFTYAAWHRLAVEVKADPSGYVLYELDGATSALRGISGGPGPTQALELGVIRNETTPTLAVEIDDVVLQNL